MARYWVGGTGNWDAATTTHWSATSGGAGGASVPTSFDDVIFDSASNATAFTVTVTATANCANLTIGNPASGVITFTGNSTLNIYGNLSMATGALVTHGSGGGAGIFFRGTSGTKTITSNGVQFSNNSTITFNGAATFQLVDALRPCNLTRTSGTFDPNGQDVIFNQTTNAINGTLSFYNLTFNGPAQKTAALLMGTTAVITITNVLTLTGNSAVNRIFFGPSTIGSTRTVTAASITASNLDIGDVTAAGAASWNLSAISGGCGDCGGNTGITFTSAADQHWLNASSSSWSTAANWTTRVPLPQDNVFMDKAFGTSQTITCDMPRMGKSVDWTGATWTTALTWTVSTSSSLYGSLTLISGLTVSNTPAITFEGRSTYIIKTFAVTIERQIILNAPGGTLTLDDNLTLGVTRTLTVTNGTLNTSTYILSTGLVSLAAGGTLTLGNQTHLLTGVGSVFSANVSSVVNANSSVIKITNTTNSAITFTSGLSAGKTFYDVWFDRGASTGNITIGSPNTFHDFKDTGTAAHSILFTAGITTTVTTFTVSGTAGNLITINSTTTGTHTLSAPSKNNASPISCDYLNIQHSIVLQANTWYAGVNSVNNQATATAGSGWIFTAPAIVLSDTSSFFQLF